MTPPGAPEEDVRPPGRDGPVLVIAATSGELAGLLEILDDYSDLPLPYGRAVTGTLSGVPCALAWLGVGKTATAAGTALAIERLRPKAVVQLGVGGAFPRSGLQPGEVAVGASELHVDLGARSETGFEDLRSLGLSVLEDPVRLHNAVPVDAGLSTALAGRDVPLLPFGTAETVTGDAAEAARISERTGVAVESMEGAAAAQVCLALGVPFAQVRGVSNAVGERDKGEWRMGGALQAAQRVLLRWLEKGAPIEPER